MKIEEIGQYVVALEKQLQNVNKHASMMVKRSRDSAHTTFEFAQSLTWLGQCEGDELGAALTQVCVCTVYSQCAKHVVICLVSTFNICLYLCRHTLTVITSYLYRLIAVLLLYGMAHCSLLFVILTPHSLFVLGYILLTAHCWLLTAHCCRLEQL